MRDRQVPGKFNEEFGGVPLGLAARRRSSGYLVLVRWWLPLLALSIVPALQACATCRRKRRNNDSRCRTCGYDLRATPDRCPECGAVRL